LQFHFSISYLLSSNSKQVKIEFTAKQDKNYDKAFKPLIFANGKWVYTTARCRKTMNGALNYAKKLAEQHAKNYPSLYTDITIVRK